MVALTHPGYVVALVIHILSAMVAVGSVTITDYFHILGLRNKVRERKFMFVYPYLSKMVIASTVLLIISGSTLIAFRPELLDNELFQFKMFLFVIVLINGLFLHRNVFPKMVACVEKKSACNFELLFLSSLGGSISLVTWYAIMILAIIKSLGFLVSEFAVWYLLAFLLCFAIGFFIEKRMRHWTGISS